MILEILADGIRASFEERSIELARQLAAFGAWLREVSTPPPGAELRVPDGSQYSGIVVVDRNVVIALLGSRQSYEPPRGHPFDAPRSPAPPLPSPWSPDARPPEPRPRYREDEPLWRTDDTPYR